MRDVTGMIFDIHFIDANVGFIAGASEADKAHARILKTTDGGKSWRPVFDSDRAGDNNWKLAFPSANVGYGTIISYQAPKGEARGYVVKTVDGGDHWNRLKVTDDSGWVTYGINFIDDMHEWVGGLTGGFETGDGGQSWVPAKMGLSANETRFVKRPMASYRSFELDASGRVARRRLYEGPGTLQPTLVRTIRPQGRSVAWKARPPSGRRPPIMKL